MGVQVSGQRAGQVNGMAKSSYTIRRRFIQGLSLGVLALMPLRLLCVDADHFSLRVFGMEFGLATMFYPLFTIVGLLLGVVLLSMKKGRIFCSHMCPMHMFLEIVNSPANKHSDRRSIKVWLVAVPLSLFLVQVILSFFLPMGSQLELVSKGSLPIIGIGSALFAGFLILLVHYQEHFCKKGCPYALIQMLLQSDSTRYMEFANPEKACTNCHKCDGICPFNLRARFESRGPDCTNCNLCSEACAAELGPGNTLFHLLDTQSE